MKKKMIAGVIALSLVSGTAGAAGSYFWLEGFNEELKQELNPQIEKAIAGLEKEQAKLFKFGKKQAEKEKAYIREQTDAYLQKRIQESKDSLGTEMEVEQQVKAESDQLITEINTFIDYKFSEKGL